MATTVWKSDDIARIAAGGVAIAPSWQFAAGVVWLAEQLNAHVLLPVRSEPVQDVAVIDSDSQEATRC